MKKIDVGQSVAILANFGVIAGIGFLAYEVRQNSEVMELQARATQLDQRRSLGDLLFGQPEVLDLLLKDPADLNPSEYERVKLLGTQFFVTSEWNYFEAVRSRQDLAEVARRTRSVVNRDVLNYGARIAWPVFRETADPEYVRWFEEAVLGDVTE